jgi:TPR repeat protein
MQGILEAFCTGNCQSNENLALLLHSVFKQMNLQNSTYELALQLKRGAKEYNEKVAEAIKILEQLANKGNDKACVTLGEWYEIDEVVPRNYKRVS